MSRWQNDLIGQYVMFTSTNQDVDYALFFLQYLTLTPQTNNTCLLLYMISFLWLVSPQSDAKNPWQVDKIQKGYSCRMLFNLQWFSWKSHILLIPLI